MITRDELRANSKFQEMKAVVASIVRSETEGGSNLDVPGQLALVAQGENGEYAGWH
ncbi:MAG: hypothetical protein P8M30_17150 [Planctomycetaceae bacterium]|nr:hypothetical protein [bacterium]MDB4680010.1 hypothetical protein [Planctomycetaceae bacterium]MDG2391037.1 hypothetical protein [Planctomycetaceae bacterium]